jgi:hypothetical protein
MLLFGKPLVHHEIWSNFSKLQPSAEEAINHHHVGTNVRFRPDTDMSGAFSAPQHWPFVHRDRARTAAATLKVVLDLGITMQDSYC